MGVVRGSKRYDIEEDVEADVEGRGKEKAEGVKEPLVGLGGWEREDELLKVVLIVGRGDSSLCFADMVVSPVLQQTHEHSLSRAVSLRRLLLRDEAACDPLESAASRVGCSSPSTAPPISQLVPTHLIGRMLPQRLGTARLALPTPAQREVPPASPSSQSSVTCSAAPLDSAGS